MRKKLKPNSKFVLLLFSSALLVAFTLLSIDAVGQEKRAITGTVVDAMTNEPLPGVTVQLRGTTVGTVTDIDGQFSIEAAPDNILTFRFVGYLDEEISVGDKTNIDIILAQDIIGLEEIVVTGYGVQQKSLVTGSIASVSGDDLSSIKIPSATQALQGLAAGVQVIPRTGRPGESSVIRVRGVSSLSGSDPLIIVDGVPANSLEGLNPNDIKSIEVLKDASSGAIYGATGGNGVILVTTNSGEKGELRTTFDFYRGITSPISQIDLMDTPDYLELMAEMGQADLTTARPDTFPSYNWQDFIFENAITQDYNLTISGGSERSTYMVSGNYNSQEGIVKSTKHERTNIRFHSSHDLSNWITLEQRSRYLNTVTDGIQGWEWEGYYQNPIAMALRMPPMVPDYDEEGDWGNWGSTENPFVILDMRDRTSKNNRVETNVGLILTPFKGFTYTSRFAGGLGFGEAREYMGVYQATAVDSRFIDELHQNMDRSLSWNIQNIANYSTSIAEVHNIDLMAGMEANKWWGYDINGMRVNMASDLPNMLYFNMSQNDTLNRQIIGGSGYEGRNMAFFGRFNYNYAGKYMLTANVRRDGATNFGPDNKWGVFPSVSVGWKFSDESFMDGIRHIVSFGRVRYGYGETGANARSGFPYMSTVHYPTTFRYSFDNRVALQGAAPIKIPNPEIRWESVKMSNVGLDLAFLSNRITLTTEYFSKVNDGMLMEIEVPSIAGSWQLAPEDNQTTQPEVNVGSVKNTGFEISLGGRKMEGDLRGGFNINLSFTQNEVLSLATDSIRSGSVHFVNPITLTRVGSPIASFWGYRTDGIFTENDPTIVNSQGQTVFTNQPSYTDDEGNVVYARPRAQAGDVRYIDENGDGKVLTDDDKVILGDPHPDLIFGFSFNLEYKSWDLSAFFNGTYGNDLFSGTKQYLYYSQGIGNRAADYTNRYRDEMVVDGEVVVSENHNTTMPRNHVQNYTYNSDFYIEDGSYLRLRNLTIGYNVPAQLLSSINVQSLRMYVSGTNLFTLTNYTGFNPDVSGNDILTMGIDIGVYPATRMFSLGASLTF